MKPSDERKAFLQLWIEKSHLDLANVEKSWPDQDGVLWHPGPSSFFPMEKRSKQVMAARGKM